MTEPESLGPCEPGTAVKLQGIVWQETDKGGKIFYAFFPQKKSFCVQTKIARGVALHRKLCQPKKALKGFILRAKKYFVSYTYSSLPFKDCRINDIEMQMLFLNGVRKCFRYFNLVLSYQQRKGIEKYLQKSFQFHTEDI